MRTVRSARSVFGILPPIPEGLDLSLKAYNQQEVERWLNDEHGIMFLDPADLEGEDAIEESSEVELEAMGEAPSVVWDEKLGEPLMTPYEREQTDSVSDEGSYEEPHR